MLTVPLFYALSLLGVIHYNMHVLLTSGNLLAYRLMFFIYLLQLYLTISYVEITMCPAPI